jgi:hypothetical protein
MEMRESLLGEGGWTSPVALDAEIKMGAHELYPQLLEAGLVLRKTIVDLGGYKTTLLGPLESSKCRHKNADNSFDNEDHDLSSSKSYLAQKSLHKVHVMHCLFKL